MNHICVSVFLFFFEKNKNMISAKNERFEF